jgi:phosphatidylserine/phosphatidylglycerophosphate/cardiolipin synthase-like enzyme
MPDSPSMMFCTPWPAAAGEPSDHAKLVVADDHVLLGSHNWSPGALTDQTEDSVLMREPGLAGHFATRILALWSVAREEGFDAPP